MKILLIRLKLVLILLVSMPGSLVYADGDDAGIFTRWMENKKPGVSAVKFKQYKDLCGSCHFAYQPGLLPGMSWEKIMTKLESHFGQSLKMTEVEKRIMMRYVLDNSAGHVNDEISTQILQTLQYNPVPIRITKTTFFIDKHNHLENQKNIVQCDNCHQDAGQGYYRIRQRPYYDY